MIKYFIFKFSNNFSCKKIKYSKKSEMSLEALIGTIISVIALFMILQSFIHQYLQTPDNLKIAEQNAQSIVNFVDFSNNKYKELKLIQNCDFMLKLTNIENFQLNSNNDKYFYVIDDKKVYILDWKDISEVINKKKKEDTSYLNNNVKNYDFKNSEIINLKKDKTDQSLFSFDFEFWTVGGSDNIINFENNNAKLLLLIPQFKITNNIDLAGSLGSFLNSNQNNLLGEVLYSDLEKHHGDGKPRIYSKYTYEEGNYLIYEPKTNNLYLSHSSLTDTFAQNNLCYRYEINKNNLIDKNTALIKSGKFDELDEINNKIIMNCLVDNKPLSGTFEWNSGPICEGNSDFCSGFNEKRNNKLNLNNIKYVDFLNQLKDNCINKFSGKEVKFSLKAIPKTAKDKISTNSDNIDFNKIFQKVSLNQKLKEIQDSKGPKRLIKLNYRSTESCNDPSIGCDYIYLIGNEVSFFYDYKQQYHTHDSEFTHFLYTININYLRKTSDNNYIYFNNQKIKLDKPKVYNLKKGFFKFIKPDDVTIYKGLIQLGGGETIYLTQTQVDNILLQN